ncbi:glycoside hydrolase 5 family protein [Flavobacterium sp. RSP15]|uniref:glycoside hydrolase 5 family protein n=1 Tax=Flavobacterium sp. RSP15 TaxID=2497485 RepID=UPI000F846CF3|nr:mannanase [Flavobacterium sp. RSP15]RTY86236.1 mannanase [Flavobacterium sp. RSP15]
MKKIIKCFIILFIIAIAPIVMAQSFISVKKGIFLKEGKPYRFLGSNFWYGMNLGSSDKDRLVRELDRLNSIGIKNLRIMAASEGNESALWRIQPALQTAPNVYNENLLVGLDFLLVELRKRGMVAVMCLNNFWPWSGGFAQYVSWANANESIPYPPPAENGNWRTYQHYSARFYSDTIAKNQFNIFLKKIINRVNSINNIAYKEDPTIMAWQLANEPEGSNNILNYRRWLHDTAKTIKKLDANHLVSIGSEGNTPSSENGTNFEKDHNSPYIDYFTFHLWIQNWDWFDPIRPEDTYQKALVKVNEYIDTHVQIALKFNKPIVLEEFGISRDKNSYSPSANVTIRDIYYATIFNKINNLSKSIPMVSGVNFWAWSGEGRPNQPKSIWKIGDDFTGDPPHEFQGWYSVYDTDKTTIEVLKKYANKINTEK